jgi:hypothetical protein
MVVTETTWHAQRRAMLEDEERLWNKLHALIDTLSEEEAVASGYYEEGWSAKDVIAHIGSWLAEAGIALERLRMGTYRPQELDIETLNQQCLRGLKDVPLDVVRAQAIASRIRMLQEWAALPAPSAEADMWIRKAGADHYREHLPRLQEWVETLRVRHRAPVDGP